MSQGYGGPGLQPERTALAWQRTAVAALALVVSTAVLALRVHRPLYALAGAVVSAGSAALVLAVHRRFRDLDERHPGGTPFQPMLAVAVVVVLGGLGGAGIALAMVLG